MRRITQGRNVSDPHLSPFRACAGLDPNLFFPSSADEAAVAQRVCGNCPVLSRCAAWALRTELTHCVVASVWLPRTASTPAARRAVRAQLEQVEASGVGILAQSREVA